MSKTFSEIPINTVQLISTKGKGISYRWQDKSQRYIPTVFRVEFKFRTLPDKRKD